MDLKIFYLVLFLPLSLRKARVLRIVLKPFKYYKNAYSLPCQTKIS